ncbi:DNA-binding LacI/PurR family transcriptional regulator [Motilibacter rhizosphaerae]|uniref:DNA-binding LacI/PurR family transcriptional regulator n=1 Tax=Motilibacter rhizosphaerae TaxID=598652 RepID=A0A4Q7NQK4_9ACTN|nr:LacI family DNA-binding transcriptional regulator [Motilibacter rhizosphaerae]RZS87422.1 DNA-binding LacI/PurR family transcriptional regulator [Motilibacter rhizosphaerae]
MQSNGERRPARMDDVAAAAGVSHQTVSRVLNGADSVRPETRARVLAAVERLGYRRNVAARALASRRSQTIGVLTAGTQLFGPTGILHGIEQAARQADYYLSIASEPVLELAAVRRALARLTEQAVDGIVVVGPQEDAQGALVELAERVPVVVVDGHAGPGPTRVYVDHLGGARAATAHLLEQGVRTVHHVAGPPDWGEAADRRAGWEAVLREAGRAVPRPLAGDWSAGSGYAAGCLLAVDPEVEAVFVANDQMALGVLRAMAEVGRRCPEDVLLAGFDDVPEAGFFWPPLTTVRQDFPALGRASIDLLLQGIAGGAVAGAAGGAGGSPRREVAVPAQLVVRASSHRLPVPSSA